MEAIRNGDESAFKAFYEAYGGQLYGFAIKHTNDAQLAEDIVQQAFVQLWQKRTAIQSPLAFKAYLFATTRHLIFDEYKRRLAEQEATLIFNDLNQMSSEEETYQMLLNELMTAIQTLPPKRRQIFEMHKLQGLSHKEIATNLSISVSTVEKQIIAALKTLRQKLSHLAFQLLL